jgi:2-keto-3-deoxy-L-rhamnonate aldolase RhmA
MSVAKKDYKRITTKSLIEMKANGEKISMLTAYDTMAKIVDTAGIDVILVGDSASNGWSRDYPTHNSRPNDLSRILSGRAIEREHWLL